MPSPTSTACAPAARKASGWSEASEPATITRAPPARAAAIIWQAASRMRPRHILVRKLKLSSYSTTTSGRVVCREASKSSTPSASIASNRLTVCPICRSSAATWIVASGGYGLPRSHCFGSNRRK